MMYFYRFVHLFMADIIASGFLHILEYTQLYHQNQFTNHILIDNKHIHHSIYYNTTLKSIILPKPLYNISNLWNSICETNQPYLLDISSNNHYFKPKNLTSYELMTNVGWRKYIDYHNKPGIMINKYSDINQRILTFNYTISKNNNIYQRNNEYLRNYILKIKYLKSYENMGKIKVIFCNNLIDYIDGLDYYHINGTYTSGRAKKVSIPSIVIYDDLYVRCNHNNEFKLELVYYTDPLIDEKENAIRKSAKFKLLSIEICIPSKEF